MGDPGTVNIAIATFMVLWTSTVLIGAAWLNKQLKANRDEILTDFNQKHAENNRRYEALLTLVIRHDAWFKLQHAGNPSQHG